MSKSTPQEGEAHSLPKYYHTVPAVPGKATISPSKPSPAMTGGVIDGVGAYVRESLLSLVPPHIRRKGFICPPVNSVLRKSVGMLALPYFPWASMDWAKYPQFVAHDVLAGITVAIMLVPQGLAYALMASLPPIYGLYAATVAGYVYSLFGTSGQLTLGPVALVSLFLGEVFTGLGVSLNIKDPYATYQRTTLAASLSLVVGLELCVMALLRVGSLMKFVSPSVMTGFVTGSGVYIFLSQAKYLFGFKVPRMAPNYKELHYFLSHLHSKAQPYAMVVGLPAFLVLFAFHVFKGHFKARINRLQAQGHAGLAKALRVALASVMLVTIIVATLLARHLITQHNAKLQIVGAVPSGFNQFTLPLLPEGLDVTWSKLLVHALPITFLTYMESISVGQKFATVNRYALDMTQELWALGLGCVAASFFQAYPPGGSFSRTALKAEVGVKTPFANVITSLFVTVILVAATRLLYYVPQAVLGALICTAVMALLDFKEMWRALWVAPVDFGIMILTFSITVFWNVEAGLQWGLLASVLVLLLQISRLDMDSIGQLSLADDHTGCRSTKLRPVAQYPGAVQHEQVRILRLSANLFFGNVSVFRDEFYRSLAVSPNQVRAVVIDSNGVVDMDLSALAVIDDLVAEVGKQHVQVYFAGAHERVVKALDSYDLLQDVGGEEVVVLNVEDVYYAVLDSLQLHPLPHTHTHSHSLKDNKLNEKTKASPDILEAGIPSVLELARQRSNRSRSNSLSHAEEGKDERATTRLDV